jgi:two-component system, NtrC family, response regulator HydG
MKIQRPEISEELRLTLDEVRRRYVIHVLEACRGNQTGAARVLQIDRKTLYRRLRQWGVDI